MGINRHDFGTPHKCAKCKRESPESQLDSMTIETMKGRGVYWLCPKCFARVRRILTCLTDKDA